MNLKGTVIHVGPVVQVADQLRKRAVVVRDGSEEIKLEALQGTCDLLNNVNRGDEVEISFSIKGSSKRMSTGPKAGKTEWFNQLQVVHLKVTEEAPTPTCEVDDAEPATDLDIAV